MHGKIDRLFPFAVVFLLFVVVSSGDAQSVVLRPFGGYTTVFMKNVNDLIKEQIFSFREITGEPIPFPEKINGNYEYGAEIHYHLNEGYFLTLGGSFYSEEVRTQFSPEGESAFDFRRKVSLLNFSLGIQNYLAYSTWKRVNAFLFFDVSLAFANSNSLTKVANLAGYPETNTQGEFSANALNVQGGLGVDLRISSELALWAKAGFRYANMGQMEGEIVLLDGTKELQTTRSSFDYSGFFARAGVGINLGIFDSD